MIKLFPDPFSSEINIVIQKYDDINKIAVYNTRGARVETFEKSAIRNIMQIGTTLQNGVYIVKVYGINGAESYKIIKNSKS